MYRTEILLPSSSGSPSPRSANSSSSHHYSFSLSSTAIDHNSPFNNNTNDYSSNRKTDYSDHPFHTGFIFSSTNTSSHLHNTDKDDDDDESSDQKQEDEVITFHSPGSCTPRKRKFSLHNTPRSLRKTSMIQSPVVSYDHDDLGSSGPLTTRGRSTTLKSTPSSGSRRRPSLFGGGVGVSGAFGSPSPRKKDMGNILLTNKRRVLETSKRGSIKQDIRLSASMEIVQYSATDFGIITRNGEIVMQDLNGNAGEWVQVLTNTIETIVEERLEEKEGLRPKRKTSSASRQRSNSAAVNARRSVQNFVDELHHGTAVRTSLKQIQQQFLQQAQFVTSPTSPTNTNKRQSFNWNAPMTSRSVEDNRNTMTATAATSTSNKNLTYSSNTSTGSDDTITNATSPRMSPRVIGKDYGNFRERQPQIEAERQRKLDAKRAKELRKEKRKQSARNKCSIM